MRRPRQLAFTVVALCIGMLCASPATAGEDAQERALEEKASADKPAQPATSAHGFMLYGRFGWGLAPRNEEDVRDHDRGTAFGFGLRYEQGHFGVDLSGMSVLFHTLHGHSGTLVRGMGMYILTPDKSHSAYGAAGLGWGVTHVFYGGPYSARERGLQGEAALGYYLFRTSPFRLFVEGNATLPFYTVDDTVTLSGQSRWAPHFTLSLGAAFDFLNLF